MIDDITTPEQMIGFLIAAAGIMVFVFTILVAMIIFFREK